MSIDTSGPDNIRNDFKEKIKSWFHNKGIVSKLELYLRSQLVIEFQRRFVQTIKPTENIAISPKIQAVKLLIADFLLQEDLLFSLSVFCSEVPFLLNLTYYSNYVSYLAYPTRTTVNTSSKVHKPKFSETDVSDILEALGLHSKERTIFLEFYKNCKFGSLLSCLLCSLSAIMKRYRYTENNLSKIQKKEKNLQKLFRSEKAKLKRMYIVLQEAYNIVQKHRDEMKKINELQLEMKQESLANEMKANELGKKEAQLMLWHKTLELKESNLEESYRNKVIEVEKKSKVLQNFECDLQFKYQMLQNKEAELHAERKYILKETEQMKVTECDEMIKSQEYGQKFHSVQHEGEIIKNYGKGQSKEQVAVMSRGVQCVYDVFHRSQQTENDVYISMEEYVNLIKEENAILKLSSNKQRYNINQLSSEISSLRNKVDYLEKEMKMRSELLQENNFRYVAHKLYFPKKYWHSDGSCKHQVSRRSVDEHHLSFRRKLFPDTETIPCSEYSSTGTSITDDIVADTVNKVEKLENASESLDRNCKSLERLISRNIAFNDRIFGSSSISDTSPRAKIKHFSQASKFSDIDNSNLFLSSAVNDGKNNGSPVTPFQKVFTKYKKERVHLENKTTEKSYNEKKIDVNSELPNNTSSPERSIKAEVIKHVDLHAAKISQPKATIVHSLVSNKDRQTNNHSQNAAEDILENVIELKEENSTRDILKSHEEEVPGLTHVTDLGHRIQEELNVYVDSASSSKSDIVISAGSVDSKNSTDFWN